jgi:hypothetical protein
MKINDPVQLVADRPRSIMITKTVWARLYGPFAVLRRMPLVFPAKSKSCWVDRKIAEWVVKNYPEIKIVGAPDPEPPHEPPQEKYSAMKWPELMSLGKSLGVFRPGMKRSDLIQAIKGTESD